MPDYLIALAGQWAANMQTDLARYAIFAIGVWLVLWVALRGVLAARKIRPDTPPARQLGMEFLVSLRSIAIFSTIAAGSGALAGPQAASGIAHAFIAAGLLASVASVVALAVLPRARHFVPKLQLNPAAMPMH